MGEFMELEETAEQASFEGRRDLEKTAAPATESVVAAREGVLREAPTIIPSQLPRSRAIPSAAQPLQQQSGPFSQRPLRRADKAPPIPDVVLTPSSGRQRSPQTQRPPQAQATARAPPVQSSTADLSQRRGERPKPPQASRPVQTDAAAQATGVPNVRSVAGLNVRLADGPLIFDTPPGSPMDQDVVPTFDT